MKEKSKKMCVGCYNNYYNHSEKNGCWSFDSATIENKLEVSIDQCPPYNKNLARPVLSCFRRQKYVQVKPEALTKEGFWKE